MHIQTCFQELCLPLPSQLKGMFILTFLNTKINCLHQVFLLVPPLHTLLLTFPFFTNTLYYLSAIITYQTSFKLLC